MSVSGDRPPLTSAQQALVEKHTGIVDNVIRTMPGFFAATMGQDEFRALGYIGLVEAAQTHDTERETPFPVFATARVRGAMLDGIRRAAPHLMALAEMSRAASNQLEREYDRIDLMDTAAVERERLDNCIEGVVVAMISAHSGAIHRMGEQGIVARDLYAKTVSAVRGAMQHLPDKELALLRGHHFEDRPLKDVAAELGIPYPTAKKNVRSAIERLTKHLRALGLIEARAS